MLSSSKNPGSASQRTKKRQMVPSATATPSSGQVIVGSGLPRQARARLGLIESGTRKRTGSKLSAANVGKEPRAGGSDDIPPILYSDGQHGGLFSSPNEFRAPSSSPGTDKGSALTASRMEDRPKRYLKEKSASMPRPWNAKVDARGRNFNQQPQLRGTTHKRPSHQRSEYRQELRRMKD